jgi:hypothetical protein
MGINQFCDDNYTPRSSASKITTDANARETNWVFFAVTYDSTNTGAQVKFYFGNRTNAATASSTNSYSSRGAVGATISNLCIGHFNIAIRGGNETRMFRGLIDEVQVFNEALSLVEIQQVQFSPNRLPVATNRTLGTTVNQAAGYPLIKLLRGCSDADGDTLTVSGVSPASTNGGTVLLTSTNVIYTPANNYVGADAFTFTVSDGHGGTASGTVLVTVSNGQSFNIVSYAYDSGAGTMTVTFAGIPGYTYRVQYATTLTPPANWTDLSTNTAPPDGLWQVVDPAGSMSRFYRTVYP